MLHLLINTHNPESCAFRDDGAANVLKEGANRLGEVAEARGARLEQLWVNRAAHKFFALIEAPDAHTVDDLIVECGWIGHTDSEVFAVMSMQAAIESHERQS